MRLYPATYEAGGEFGLGTITDGPMWGARSITCLFGSVDRWHPATAPHTGIDLGWYADQSHKPEGNIDRLPLYTRLAATCIGAGFNSVNGHFVVLLHGGWAPGNLVQYLGHMASPSPFVYGDAVPTGAHVGDLDNTGLSSGPHVHWMFYRVTTDGSRLDLVDPLSVLGDEPPPPVVGPQGVEEGSYDVPPKVLRQMDIALAQVALAVVQQELGPGRASVQLIDTGDDQQVGVLLVMSRDAVLAAYPPGF